MPRTVTTTKEVYKFSELSDSAKERAREWYREGNLDYEWWDFVYEDATTIAKILGIDLEQKPVKLMNGSQRWDPSIFFSGFWSQGDGACFEGTYRYAAGSVKAIKQHAPQDKKLHQIAERLYEAQRKCFYSLTATIEHRGHYYHSGCMSIDVDSDRDCKFDRDDIVQPLRDFADWIYKSLESEHDYLTSDESVDDMMEANDYEFDEDGNRF
jgi:hypothetical protein